jgi:hypothetical protein
LQRKFALFDKYIPNLNTLKLMKSYSIQEINEVLKGTIVGETTIKMSAPEQLELASINEISFIGNKKYEILGIFQSLCRHC